VGESAQRSARNRQRAESHISENQKEFEQKIAALVQHRGDKSKYAQSAKDQTKSEHATKVNEARVERANKAAAIKRLQEMGPTDEGVVVIASQLSNRPRQAIDMELQHKQHKLATRRKEQLDESQRIAEEKRQALLAKCEGIRQRKAQSLEDNQATAGARDAETAQRLELMRQDHAAKVAQQREYATEHLNHIHNRHTTQMADWREKTRNELEERQKHHMERSEERNKSSQAKIESIKHKRNEAKQKQEQMLKEQLDQEESIREEVRRRSDEQSVRNEERKALQNSLISSRRLATMQFSQLKREFSEQQRRAQISLGPNPEDGKKQLEELLSSLQGFDKECRDEPKSRTAGALTD